MAQWVAESFDTYPMDAFISLGTNKTKVLGMAWQTLDNCLTFDTKGLLEFVSTNENTKRFLTVATRIKLDQILEIADRLHVEIIGLQETKLCEQRLLNAKGYNIVRRDRASGGGGLMFLIRDVHFQRLPDIGNETSDLEYLGITVHSKDRTITIKNLYHPPNSQHLDTNMTEGLFDDYTII
ncbi:hypothetical protein TNCV_2313631 [Trichonephila clavipes]|nr:hypothetical protein TNCV_2313631 [Trichonephila clavipes]